MDDFIEKTGNETETNKVENENETKTVDKNEWKVHENENQTKKVPKHFKISEWITIRIEAYARHWGSTESEVADKAFAFWLLNKNLKVERDSSLHLTTTAFEEKCTKCGHDIPAVSDALYNKNLGWVCLDCASGSHGDKALAKKILTKMQLERANNILQQRLYEKTEKFEVIDNKEKVRELLLQIEQNVKSRDEIARNLIRFLQEFIQYSDFDAKAFLEKISNDEKRCHDILQGLTPILQFLERTASDQIALVKRRRSRLEASADHTDSE